MNPKIHLPQRTQSNPLRTAQILCGLCELCGLN